MLLKNAQRLPAVFLKIILQVNYAKQCVLVKTNRIDVGKASADTTVTEIHNGEHISEIARTRNVTADPLMSERKLGSVT